MAHAAAQFGGGGAAGRVTCSVALVCEHLFKELPTLVRCSQLISGRSVSQVSRRPGWW
jgi:hypothetical protein